MMLKSMGIDITQFQAMAANVMEKVTSIEASQARIELKLDLLTSVLKDGGQMDSMNHVENESDHATEIVLTGA